jgi:hypothetical protein
MCLPLVAWGMRSLVYKCCLPGRWFWPNRTVLPASIILSLSCIGFIIHIKGLGHEVSIFSRSMILRCLFLLFYDTLLLKNESHLKFFLAPLKLITNFKKTFINPL